MNTFLDNGIFKTYNKLNDFFVRIYVHIRNANFKMHKPHNPMYPPAYTKNLRYIDRILEESKYLVF